METKGLYIRSLVQLKKNIINQLDSIKKRLLNGFAIKYNLKDLYYYLIFFISNHNIKNDNLEKNHHTNIKVISLIFRQDRRSYIKNLFNKLNIPFTFFNAIHGNSEDLDLYHDDFTVNSFNNLSMGSIGCIESHTFLWKELKNSQFDSYLIFEDDINLNIRNDELQNMLHSIPKDFDIVYFGSGSYKNKLTCRKVSNNLMIPFSIRKGAYGYMISKEGAAKLLKTIYPIQITCGGIDTILGVYTMRKLLRAYHFYPEICSANNFFESNIYNISIPNKKIHFKETI